MPEAAEIYPPNFATYVNVDGLSERLEGRIRPGHFRGVSTVVLKVAANCAAAILLTSEGKTRSRRRSFRAWPAT